MKRIIATIAAFAAILVSPIAIAQSIPRYNPEAYCKQVADISGGSAMIFNGCMEMEQDAYDKRKAGWSSISGQAASYCDEVARVSGGSYMILDGCLDMEADAMATTPSFQF